MREMRKGTVIQISPGTGLSVERRSMTTITLDTNSIEISGHAKEAVVCHGISAISQMVANYVENHEWGKVETGDGYLKISDVKDQHYGNPLFAAMVEAMKDIENEYPGNIEFIYAK